MWKRVIAAMLFAAALLGCSKNEEPSAVDFSLPNLKNEIVHLRDYRGKWIIVNFWATWCGPCLKEIPELIRFQKNNVDGSSVVIGINFEEIDSDSLSKFIQNKGINYPIVKAGKEPILPFEPLKGLPTTFLINPEGLLVARHIGPVTAKLLGSMIENNRKTLY